MTISATVIADLPRSKKLAKLGGHKHYLGGECKHHPGQHLRWATNGCCVDCVLIQATKWRKANGPKLTVSRKVWDRLNPEKAMLQRARRRAKDLGLSFNLKVEDIVIPELCPVFSTPLMRATTNQDNSPSLDRIDNSLGYVHGNVVVVSFKANRLKSNASLSDLKKVVDYYAQHLG